jgi:hypothetical protein
MQGIEPQKCVTMYSTDSLKHAKGWIRSCSSHTLCGNEFIPENHKQFRPTRVLQVDQEEICLVETSILPMSPTFEYAALSHCWGGSKPKQLLKHNYPAMKQSITIADLPKNFRDAISITREIEFKYLWIDSLCIIQDCEDDKNREIADMGLIYARAICTISATASKDSEGGCVSEKDFFMNDCVLRKQGRSSLVVKSWVHEGSGLAELFKQKVEPAPLSTRAWAFQERVLASRVLHFCDGIVLFECNTLRASEYHVDGVSHSQRANVRVDGKLYTTTEIEQLIQPEERFVERTVTVRVPYASTRPTSRPAGSRLVNRTESKPNPNFKSQEDKVAEFYRLSARWGMRGSFEMLLRFSGSELAEKLEFHQSWYEMVEQYSIRDLTFPADKVNAIVGVADFIQQGTNVKFVAGVWTEMLIFNLLWVLLTEPKARPSRPVPTWSWTSVEGRISHRLKVSSKKSDRLIQLLNSSLSETRGNAVRLRNTKDLAGTAWKRISPHISVESVEPTLESGSLIHNATLALSCHLCDVDLSKVNFIRDIDLDSTEATVCLPILSFQNTQVHPIGRPLQLHGIALRAKPSPIATCTYERVGYFWTATQAVANEILENLGDKLSIRIV